MKAPQHVATSAVRPKKAKRKRKTGTQPAATAPKDRLSKKALRKLQKRKIAYKPFTEFKESQGTPGNYRKLIYNTPKY